MSNRTQPKKMTKYAYGTKDMMDNVVDNPKTNAKLIKKAVLKCKNPHQKEFAQLIDANQITICIGDSGVGKSYVSLVKAISLFQDPKNGYNKIFIITPIVEVEDSVGYLKGSLTEKLDPYLYSIYYIIDGIIGEAARKKMVEMEIIKPLCISYIRGQNIDNAILISDETQNMSVKGVKTLLTRIGSNSKFILSGDINQVDRFRKVEDSGLYYAYNNLQNIDGIGCIAFEKSDIVRNPIIAEILERFE